MSLAKRIVVVGLWVASMFMAGMWGYAQTPVPAPQIRTAPQPQSEPTILSGNDLGFRVDRYRGSTPVGRLMVRIDGRWVEFEESVTTRRLTSR